MTMVCPIISYPQKAFVAQIKFQFIIKCKLITIHIKIYFSIARNVDGKGKGMNSFKGIFTNTRCIGDLECPKCFHHVDFWQGKKM